MTTELIKAGLDNLLWDSQTYYFSLEWGGIAWVVEESVIIPIYKKGDKTGFSN